MAGEMAQAVEKDEDGSNIVAFPERVRDPAPQENAVGPVMRAGERLKAARLEKGVDLPAAAKELRIREAYLQAIEDMYVAALPAGGYLNAYLRTYARYLGLPDDKIITQFSEECGAVSQAPKQEPQVAPPKRSISALRAVGAGLASAVAVSVLAWVAVSFSDGDAGGQSDLARNAAKESLFTEAATTTVSAQLPLALTAVESGWVEVRGSDGTIFVSRAMSRGERYFPRIGAGWTVSAEDGGAFEWRVGDAAVGLLGESGAPAYAISVDRVAQDAAASTAPALAGAVDGRPSR